VYASGALPVSHNAVFYNVVLPDAGQEVHIPDTNCTKV
jgi:hypothetical protein